MTFQLKKVPFSDSQIIVPLKRGQMGLHEPELLGRAGICNDDVKGPGNL